MRDGADLVDADGRVVGKVTSGGFGPTLGGPIAMGYVDTTLATAGTALNALVRGQQVALSVASVPFVPNRYKRS